EIIQRFNGGRGQEESPESEQMEEDEGLEPTALSKDEHEPINRILYIQNLPSDVTDEMLSCLFQQYPGFKEVRLVPGRTDIAFVEYEAGHQAAVAKDVLNGFKLTVDKEMKVTFARRG
ncbi:1290_t:CDS:2, partial [Paraglomus occultum]